MQIPPEIFYGLGALILAGVLAWAMTHNRRSETGKRMTEEATRLEYDRPAEYEKRRAALEREARRHDAA